MSRKTNSLILAGVFIALGVVLPMAFHMFGGAGPVFLPMHIPVLIAGFFLSPLLAFSVGVMTPLLSSVLTGMPPLFPMMPIMMLELGLYGLVISILHLKATKNVYVLLVVSMIVGRLGAGTMVFALSTFFAAKLPPVGVFLTGAVTKGFLGIAIQLIIVPVIVLALKKSNFAFFREVK